jgi:hypothetical protein
MRNVKTTCDWCNAEVEVEDVDPVEIGWTSVEKYDTIVEEVVSYDFCSPECLVTYFSDT